MVATPRARKQFKQLLLGSAVFAACGLAAPAAAQTCTPLVLGVTTCPGGDPTITVDIPAAPSADPITVVLEDGFETVNTVSVATLAGVDAIIQSDGTSEITTTNVPGLVVDSGQNLTAQVNTINTAGDGATGALLRAVDSAIFTSDDLVTTLGDNADGINIQGSDVTIDGNIVRTEGDNSDGIEAVSLDGPIDVDADLIETNGLLSDALILRGTGAIGADVGVLRTGGDQALGANISNDAAACILLGNGACGVTLAADEITTDGFGSIGALVSAVGPTDISIGALQTNGDQAAGLDLSVDPAACVVLGAGACDQAFTVGDLTTNGDNAPGALVRAAGNVDGNISVLRTNGQDSIGLDIASDPAACVILGAGACDTAFSVGELTTTGDGAIGALIRASGATTGSVTTADTLGAGATAIDIAADPVACVLLGAGACDVALDAGQATTQGDGAAGVLIITPANILANIGSVFTAGDNATGVGLFTDPAVCVVIGPGACGIEADIGDVGTGGDDSPGVDVDGGEDPIDVTTGDVTTEGDNSPGVDVTGTGPISVETGDVTTEGDNSPGVVVDGDDDPIDVTTGDVTTSGDDSDGINVSGTGQITVDAGTVTTSGDNSDGIEVDGGAGPVYVEVDGVVTTGANSDGIDVTTTTGSIGIVAGPITVSGPGSDGITASAAGCADVNITATGAIASATGTGISASSACAVTVTTIGGAPVSGAVAGIDVTSGTGATVTIGDRLSSTGGPALNVDGAAANVTTLTSGRIVGRIDLTDNNDTLTNNGRFDAFGDSAFGAGTDAFINTGVLSVRPGSNAPGNIAFTGLESFTNAGGIIDMRNGAVGDTLTLTGTYTGTGNSRLGIDVGPGTNGGATDRLIITGAATGSTTILTDTLATGPGLLVNNVVVVDAGAGTSATAFTLGGAPIDRGFVTYTLAFNPTGNDFALFGTPNSVAYQTAQLGMMGRTIFYRGNDAISSHMDSMADNASGNTADNERPRSSALWFVPYGSYSHYDRDYSAAPFGQAMTVSNRYSQDVFGIQGGYDFSGADGSGSLLGVTVGYANSMLRFDGEGTRYNIEAANVGAYGRLDFGAFFLSGIARYEHYWVDLKSPVARLASDTKGNSYGGKLEVGGRFGDRFFFEPSASIEYVKTDFDSFSALSSTFDFADGEGLRGKAGARIGSVVADGPSVIRIYAAGYAVHEFKGEDSVTFSNNGSAFVFQPPRLGTYGEAKLGFSADVGSRVTGFIEAHGEYGSDYKGVGGRAGLSLRF